MAAERPRLNPEFTGLSSDPADALRSAEMPHQTWQIARAQQLAARSGAAEAAPAPAASRPPQPVDPNRTQVFQPGPDGKLHPIPGWQTTGPFDYGQWAHNVDWATTGKDLRHIISQSLLGLVPWPHGIDELLRLKDFHDMGRETLEDLRKADEQSGGKRVP